MSKKNFLPVDVKLALGSRFSLGEPLGERDDLHLEGLLLLLNTAAHAVLAVQILLYSSWFTECSYSL